MLRPGRQELEYLEGIEIRDCMDLMPARSRLIDEAAASNYSACAQPLQTRLINPRDLLCHG